MDSKTLFIKIVERDQISDEEFSSGRAAELDEYEHDLILSLLHEWEWIPPDAKQDLSEAIYEATERALKAKGARYR